MQTWFLIQNTRLGAYLRAAIVPLTGLYPYFVMQALCCALFACAYLLIGYSGLLSIGHAMFLGTGGYVSAHALKDWGVSPEIGGSSRRIRPLGGCNLARRSDMPSLVMDVSAVSVHS